MDKITFTLAGIKAHSPCEDGYKKLCKNLRGVRKYGKDTPISIRQIYESNGYADTLWCLRVTRKEVHYLWRHFAVDCAEMVEHLMRDKRSRAALKVARRHADGGATDGELMSAEYDARSADEFATRAAAWAAASAAARGAAWSAAWAAAWSAAREAAREAASAAQMKLLEIYCREGKRPENSIQLLKDLYKKQLEKKK